MADIQYYGTGRRKTSTARVYLRPGSGEIIVNRRTFDTYFPNEALRMIIRQPLSLTDTAGKFDILVNVAGLTDRGTIWDTSPELFDRMFAVNVRAPFFLMQDSLKIMRREGIRGSVVNILSMSAHGGQSFISAYCGSKGALATLTKNVAFSVMRHGIRVNGLCIGWMDTPGEDSIMRRYHGAQDGWKEEAEAKLPTGRLLKVDEVARAVAFLASEESGLMTGSIIDFDQSIIKYPSIQRVPGGASNDLQPNLQNPANPVPALNPAKPPKVGGAVVR